MHDAQRRVMRAHTLKQLGGQLALARAQCGGVPLGAVAVIDGNERRLAAHGQAHVVAHQISVDLPAEGLDVLPLFFGVGLGDARRLPDALDRHFVAEFGFARLDQPADRRGGGRLRAARQRNVPFACEQPGRGVQSDPARARQIHLAPGVQIGEIDVGAGRPVQRLDISLELNQVARHKPCSHAQMTQQLHQQPGRIAAGARGVFQGEFRGLYTGLHTDQVIDVLAQALVEADQKVDSRNRHAADAVQVGFEPWRQRQFFQVRRQFALLFAGIREGDVLGVRFQKEVERVKHRHFGDQINLDTEFAGLFGEDQTRQVVALRVLLPVDEVVFRQDF